MSSARRSAFARLPGDERLTTAILSDSLDASGLRDQVLQFRLAPLVAGSRILGRAWTVGFEPSTDDNPDDPYGPAIDYISGIRAGEIAVIATDESNESAFWGELFSAAALGAGALGVITDGNLRDTDKIVGLGFPAFSLSRRPIDYRMRMKVVGVGEPVRIGSVSIDSGDLIMADDDGVVVIPKAAELEVIRRARERATGESTVLSELLAGESLRQVWDRHGIL
jgi:regulator of RNase E activity RraA